jgi:hypothetical protein
MNRPVAPPAELRRGWWHPESAEGRHAPGGRGHPAANLGVAIIGHYTRCLRADLYACAGFVERRSVRASMVGNARRSEHGDGETGGGWWCVVEDRGHGRGIRRKPASMASSAATAPSRRRLPVYPRAPGQRVALRQAKALAAWKEPLLGSSVDVPRAAGSTSSVAPSARHLRRTVSRAAPQSVTLLDVHSRRPGRRGF